MGMELTKRETRVLVLAIGVALEKEGQALKELQSEVKMLDIQAAIAERTRYMRELDSLRMRLITEN
jgi:hypothetical protein